MWEGMALVAWRMLRIDTFAKDLLTDRKEAMKQATQEQRSPSPYGMLHLHASRVDRQSE